jgi:hypothetical protein
MSRLGPVLSSAGRKPGTPTIGTATAGNGQASVTFTAPTYLGKPDYSLTYTVVSSPSSISQTGSGSPIVVTGLSNGTAYTFTVKLSNTVLDSDFSSSSNSVTPTAPTPPPIIATPPPIIATPPPIIATPPPIIATPPPIIATPPPIIATPPPCSDGCGGNAGCVDCQCNRGGFWSGGFCAV